MLSELKLPLLTDSQRDFLIKYVVCLKLMAVTTNTWQAPRRQGDKNVALGDVIPHILNLEQNLKNLKKLHFIVMI